MMYILAVSGKENEGAYAVDENNKRKVYMFLDKDDAVRYAGLLEADDFPDMSVVEVNDQEIICLLYTSPSPRDGLLSRMPSSA